MQIWFPLSHLISSHLHNVANENNNISSFMVTALAIVLWTAVGRGTYKKKRGIRRGVLSKWKEVEEATR